MKRIDFQSSSDIATFNLNLLRMLSSLSWPLCFCYFATFATARVSHIGSTVFESNWYDYPSELHKHITIIMSVSQKVVHFMGFNMIVCNLETFGMVNVDYRLMIHYLLLINAFNREFIVSFYSCSNLHVRII